MDWLLSIQIFKSPFLFWRIIQLNYYFFWLFIPQNLNLAEGFPYWVSLVILSASPIAFFLSSISFGLKMLNYIWFAFVDKLPCIVLLCEPIVQLASVFFFLKEGEMPRLCQSRFAAKRLRITGHLPRSYFETKKKTNDTLLNACYFLTPKIFISHRCLGIISPKFLFGFAWKKEKKKTKAIRRSTVLKER